MGQGDNYMNKTATKNKVLTILLTRGPYVSEAADIATKTAIAAKKMGYTVNMFLYLDGTWTAHLTTDKNYNNPGIWLETALQKKINIHMCDRCSKARDLIPENILPNINISGSYQLIELIKNSDQVLTFGG